MEVMPPKGPVCQSCSMPLEKDEQFGTNADGSPCQEYCGHCFQQGSFTAPEITLEQMIDLCSDILVERMGAPEEKAREVMREVLPRLKRWRGK